MIIGSLFSESDMSDNSVNSLRNLSISALEYKSCDKSDHLIRWIILSWIMFQGDEQLSTSTEAENILAPGIDSFFKIFRTLKTNSTRHLDRFASLS